MSNDEFTFPPIPGRSAAPDHGGPGSGRSLQKQVEEVIRHVLEAPDPEGEWVRSQLRERLAAYPGHPERALLEHLILTSGLTGATEDATAPRQGEGLAEMAFPVDAGDPGSLDAGRRHRIEDVLENRMVLTALQPIRRLPVGNVIGFEALARFVSTDGSPAATWFRDATALGLGLDLEIAALESAINAGQEIPSPLLISVNLSPIAVTDARVQYLLLTSALAPDRMVIDLTGRDSEGRGGEEDWEAVSAALDLLRRNGVRFSMEFPSDAPSILRIREIRPDIIKLDREFINDLAEGHSRDAREAGRGLARETGAVLVAEGIETQAELDAVIEAGVTVGQGFLLGRPSANPADWTSWVALTHSRADGSSRLHPGF